MPTEKLNGVDLYYEIEGDGPPLVLVHGSWSYAKRCHVHVGVAVMHLEAGAKLRIFGAPVHFLDRVAA